MTRANRLVLWMVLPAFAAGAAACTKSDSAPPVASVSLTMDKDRVALGAPVELTYRFEVAQGAKITGDYRVFVHVTRDDGTTIWVDDHELPAGLETSKWSPGQVIQYSRTRFIPPFSYLGEATVEVGLYRENERLPLSGPNPADRESPARSYKVATLQLLPRSESIQLIRLTGWYPGEYSAEDSTVEWQWTQRLATMSLRNPRRDLTLYLELDGRPDLFPDKPQQVTVYAGEVAVETFPLDRPGPHLKKIAISTEQLGAGEMAQLRIEVDRTFVPAKLPGGSRDDRDLGVRVYHAHVEPR